MKNETHVGVALVSVGVTVVVSCAATDRAQRMIATMGNFIFWIKRRMIFLVCR